MTASLDEIFSLDIDKALVPCAIESKLFGVGVESYTVASHEYALAYALTRGLVYCLDTGHFHPTEVVSAKLTAVLHFLPSVLLHLSRGVRWDSDHVAIFDDEMQRIMDEIVWNGLTERVYIGLDYFDASINRVAAWAIGMRNARKALLSACLAPAAAIREAERAGDYTARLTLLEERRTLPLGSVWEYYCMTRGVPLDILPAIRRYERDVLAGRQGV
ncbi:MAG: L-rhamnose isomerase, partial [Clostridia bacterium]|nr:L-rhamnose isomerase [Clostridia bacterium]